MPVALQKLALCLWLYVPLLFALLHLLLWARARFRAKTFSPPPWLCLLPLFIFASATLLSAPLRSRPFSLFHFLAPPLPLLSFRMDASSTVCCLGALGIAAAHLLARPSNPFSPPLHLALLSLCAFCATATHLPFLILALVVMVALSLFSLLRLRLSLGPALLALVGLALVGSGLYLPVSWCQEVDLLNLSDLTPFLPKHVSSKTFHVVALGLPLLFLPLCEASPLTAQAGCLLIARFSSLSFPRGTTGPAVPFLFLASLLLAALLLLRARRELPKSLPEAVLMLPLLGAMAGSPKACSASLLCAATTGTAYALLSTERDRIFRTFVLGSLPPFSTAMSAFLVLASLFLEKSTSWLTVGTLLYVSSAIGSCVSQGASALSKRAKWAIGMLFLATSPLPFLALNWLSTAFKVRF